MREQQIIRRERRPPETLQDRRPGRSRESVRVDPVNRGRHVERLPNVIVREAVSEAHVGDTMYGCFIVFPVCRGGEGVGWEGDEEDLAAGDAEEGFDY